MLRNVLEDYLSSIIERDLDYPLLALLQAMGFYDIHFTHGGVEFGKDFIAKRVEEGTEYQYAIQSKKGDINQELWRNKIRGQLEEAIVTDLSHPQFNTAIPRKAILATTGRLIGNARLASQEFKAKLEAEKKVAALDFWEKEQLAQLSEDFGFAAFHLTAKGLTGFGQFYLTYSKALEGTLSDREIEEFSRLWIDQGLDYRRRIFRASLEAEIIATKLLETGRYYEAITAYLALSRLVMEATYETDEPFVTEILKEVVNDKILPLCKTFLEQFQAEWFDAERDLIRLCIPRAGFPMLQYLVWCARVTEIGGLYFFLTPHESEKEKTIAFVLDFIGREKGAAHIAGDRYAVSLVWPTLALLNAGKRDEALHFVKKGLIWLCDRLEQGWGLARYDADEKEETKILLGVPFDFIKGQKQKGSYFATVLADLAAFMDIPEFYGDVYNDIEACEVGYSYWQFPDTKAIFTIDTEEVISYPNITHQEAINRFEDYEYSEHIKHEPAAFRITEKTGLSGLLILSVLLKDRYFPKMWGQLLSPSSEPHHVVV